MGASIDATKAPQCWCDRVSNRHAARATIERMRDATEVVLHSAAQLRAHDPALAMAALANRQHGVVARDQLVELGLSRNVIARHVQRGRLHRLHRGVYAVGHRALSREAHWMAAVLASGDGAVLSHRSAAALWGIRDSRRATIDVTSPRERRRPGIDTHHARLAPDEVTMHRAIPVTTPARTLLDLAALLDQHRLARAAERAEALRLTSPTSLGALAARYPRRPGTPAIRRLQPTDTTTRSELERRFLTLLEAEKLPRPLVNTPIDRYEADFAWPAANLIAELDGYQTHATRAAFERDRARDRTLQTQGWRVLRITWRQLEDDPEQIAAELRALLTP
jgi:very-short-patch-repair endonuclease